MKLSLNFLVSKKRTFIEDIAPRCTAGFSCWKKFLQYRPSGLWKMECSEMLETYYLMVFAVSTDWVLPTCMVKFRSTNLPFHGFGVFTCREKFKKIDAASSLRDEIGRILKTYYLWWRNRWRRWWCWTVEFVIKSLQNLCYCGVLAKFLE